VAKGRSASKTTVARKASGARKTSAGREKKPLGDVLGISRARVSAPLPRGTANASARRRRMERIELESPRPAPQLSRTVGGVRGRGR
jgi:hypothetical protein